MRRVGLIGGTSWVSTVRYHRALNEGVSRLLHDAASASTHAPTTSRSSTSSPRTVRTPWSSPAPNSTCSTHEHLTSVPLVNTTGVHTRALLDFTLTGADS